FTVSGLEAGHFQLSAVYTPTGSFAGSSGTGAADVNKANATIVVNSYSGTYDANAHGLTGSATGVNGEDLSSLLSLGGSQTNFGTYAVSWSFIGNRNYKAASGSGTIAIAKASTATAFIDMP